MIDEAALWGWDPTPGIVSVWAEPDGTAHVWRRVAGALVHEELTFQPWAVLDRLDDVQEHGRRVTHRELTGTGELRTGSDLRAIISVRCSRWSTG